MAGHRAVTERPEGSRTWNRGWNRVDRAGCGPWTPGHLPCAARGSRWWRPRPPHGPPAASHRPRPRRRRGVACTDALGKEGAGGIDTRRSTTLDRRGIAAITVHREFQGGDELRSHLGRQDRTDLDHPVLTHLPARLPHRVLAQTRTVDSTEARDRPRQLRSGHRPSVATRRRPKHRRDHLSSPAVGFRHLPSASAGRCSKSRTRSRTRYPEVSSSHSTRGRVVRAGSCASSRVSSASASSRASGLPGRRRGTSARVRPVLAHAPRGRWRGAVRSRPGR